jgi:hypothetical protein
VKRVLTGLLVALGLLSAGCSRLQEAAMAPEEKVNAAFPLSPETVAARERLTALVAGDADAGRQLEDLLARRQKLRALACTAKVSVPRLASLDEVRALPLDRRCLIDQDDTLFDELALRSLGLLLQRPPLRPAVAGRAPMRIALGERLTVQQTAMAAEAGVAAVAFHQGLMQFVDLNDGSTILQLPRVADGRTKRLWLSPNGRVAAMHSAESGLRFYEVETGQRLWRATGSPWMQLLEWLPEAGAVLLADQDERTSLADGSDGTIKPLPALDHSSALLRLPGKGLRLYFGSEAEPGQPSLAELQRSPQGWRLTVHQRFALEDGLRTSRGGQAFTLHGGRTVVFQAAGDLGWVDVQDGRSGRWRLAPQFSGLAHKLDETHVLLQSWTGGGPRQWVLDVDAETVATVLDTPPRSRTDDTAPAAGVLWGSMAQLWFAQALRQGEPQPLARVVGEMLLQRQMEQAQRAGEAGRTAPPSAWATASGRIAPAPSSASIEQLLRRDDSPVPSPAPALPTGLERVPASAAVHMIGVYEGRRGDGSRGGPVRVLVSERGGPIVLALSSYESVTWMVSDPGHRVAGVLLSGHTPSRVIGAEGVPTLQIGRDYAYNAGSSEHARLRQSVLRYVGKRPIASFQGRYDGSDFVVSGS